MSKECKRDFKVGQTVYLVDFCRTNNGAQAFETKARILRVDKKEKTFVALLYRNTYQTYSFEDYGCLIFDTQKEAAEAADKLPKPKSVMYQKFRGKIYKRTVVGIDGNHDTGVYDLIIFFDVYHASIKEIGKTVFFNEEDARQ